MDPQHCLVSTCCYYCDNVSSRSLISLHWTQGLQHEPDQSQIITDSVHLHSSISNHSRRQMTVPSDPGSVLGYLTI